jgi:hypothetical protein
MRQMVSKTFWSREFDNAREEELKRDNDIIGSKRLLLRLKHFHPEMDLNKHDDSCPA